MEGGQGVCISSQVPVMSGKSERSYALQSSPPFLPTVGPFMLFPLPSCHPMDLPSWNLSLCKELPSPWEEKAASQGAQAVTALIPYAISSLCVSSFTQPLPGFFPHPSTFLFWRTEEGFIPLGKPWLMVHIWQVTLGSLVSPRARQGCV